MPDEMAVQIPNPDREETAQEDLTGRDRLVSNVIFSWGANLVFIAAGFVMPRMINQHLGQAVLGVWDFAWSFVSYFNMVEAGIGGAVSRYVAKYRMAGDISGLNRIMSSASCVLAVAGMLVLVMTVAFALSLPQLFGTRLRENTHVAQWVLLALGVSMGIQVSCSAFSGVLTGCHRWNLSNMVCSGWYGVTVVAMILALLLGKGLPSLAAVTLVGLILDRVTTVILAYRVCKGLHLNCSLVGWKTVKELYVFGGKSLIPIVSKLLLNQTTSLLIVAYLGPAALALYSRPRSLILQVDKLVQQMATTLTPTTSSLQHSGHLEEIQRLLVKSVRYSLYLLLPLVLTLTFFGGPIIELWMGPKYANGLLPAIIAIGFLVPIGQTSATRVLVGLNAHGRAGMAELVASLCSVGLALLVLQYLRWGLAGVAFAVTLPLTVMNLTYLPRLVCRRIGIDMRRYFLSVAAGPLVHVLPFVACLIVARIISHSRPLTGLVFGGAAGGLSLAVVYYRHALPDRIRSRISLSRGWRTSDQ